MYKRLLAGLLAVTVTMTGISFPDSVFAAQDDTAVVQEEEVVTESCEVTESEEAEDQEETETESEDAEIEETEIKENEIVQSETENDTDTTETEEETVEAEVSETEEQTEAIKSDISVEGTDSAGVLLAEELANVATQQEENNGCNVFSIDVSENTATVYFETTQDATLVVAVYDETGNQMLACGKKEVTHEETLTVVDIDTGTMPQYFLVRGYLIETETLRPICTLYESSMYTQEMQEFLSKTTDDFDDEKVLNLDNDTTNNFAVYGDDTIIIPESSQKNQVVSVDDTNRVYVIENADETVTSLKEGDIFAHEYGDGNVLIVKVSSIKTDGTTVTITGADTSAEEVFDYVKVDSTAGLSTAEVDDSNLEDGVTYEGLEDMSEDDDIQTYALVDGNASASMGISMKINLWTPGEKERVKITGDVSLKMTTSIKVYIATNYQYFEFRMDYKAKLGIGISGKGRLRDTKFPQIVLRPLPAIRVGYNPSLELSADVKCEFSGMIKGTVGMAVSSDDTEIKSFDSTPKVDADLELEGTIFFGFSFEPEISAEIVKVKLASASLEGKIGAESVSKASLVGKKDDTIHDCEHCIQGEIFAKGSVSIKVKLLKLEFKYDMLEMKVKVGDWYWSVGKGHAFTTCPYFKYKITVATVDDSGKVFPGSKIEGDFSVITGQGTLANAQFIKTGEDGKAIGYLPEGDYKLKISADGYKTVTKKIKVKKDKATNSMRVVLRKNGDDNGSGVEIINPDLNIIDDSSILKLNFFNTGVISTNGNLYMWGNNTNGQLGNGTNQNSSVPVNILNNVNEFACVKSDSLGVISKEHFLYTWGKNEYGQLGNGTMENSSIPVKIIENVKKANVGSDSSYAITQNGSLYTWGKNEYGQLGNGTMENSNIPVKIIENVKKANVGSDSSYAITQNGSLYTWGKNEYGQLGNGTMENSNIPVKIIENVKKANVGSDSSYAITQNGSLYTWGKNEYGQLGNGTIDNSYFPIKVLDNVIMAEVGDGYSAAITKDGSLYTWGRNEYGQLGNGTTENSNVPVKVMNNVAIVKIHDYSYVSAITKIGQLYMWGMNKDGRLGNGTANNSSIPTKILDHVIYMKSVERRCAAITTNGQLYMWGWNLSGQIGTGSTSSSYVPIKIMDNVVSIDLGTVHSGAVTRNGDLYIWGHNYYGDIGDGTTEDRYTPTKITIPGGVALPSDLTSTISAQSEESSSDSVPVLTAVPDSTQPVSEFESTDQSEEFEEEAVSVFKADATEIDTATGAQTASFKNLTPNDTYNFYVARSLTADDLLASDNILDIRQAVAGEGGRMSVTYQPRETDDNAVIFVVGSTPKDLSGAQITIGDTTYNGTAKSVTATVVCDGKTLVEGRDYLVTGGFEITGAGTYTLTIIGTGTYTGTASAAYTVTCQHSYTESITKQPTCTESGIKTFTCSICGDSQTEEIPAAGHSFSADWTIDEEATCAKEGSKSHHCSVCAAVTDITAIPKTAHTYQNKKVTKRATTSKNGTFSAVCSVCGAEQTETIYAAKTIKLSKTSMTYNGKNQKPSVTILDANKNKLKSGTDYKVTYPKKSKNVGRYTVTITLKGSYSGTVKKTFTILPKNTAISKLTASKNTVTVKWKKQTKQTAGYEIQYSTSSKFTKKTTKTVKVAKNSTTSKKITKLKAKKKYYVRIRTYQTAKVGKKTTKIYSGWSKAKMVTTRKS